MIYIKIYTLDEKGYTKGCIKYIIDGKCWECIHPTSKKEAYRVVTRHGIQYLLHRYVYGLYHGKIEDNMVVMHLCDNPLCVNPDHLKMGTQQDNIDDMHSKGRFKVNGRTIKDNIVEEIKKEILKLNNVLNWSKEEERIAKLYKVSSITVKRIRTNKYRNNN